MHIILVSVGTDGDIFPYVGLGAVLRERGHRVTLCASAHYEPLAVAQQFAFRPLVSFEENQELFCHPDFWNPVKTLRLSSNWGLRFLRRQYELLLGTVTDDAVLVANPGVLAAMLVHEKRGTPLVSLVLQPWIIRSSIAPPVMPGLTLIRHAPRPVWHLFWRGMDLIGDQLVGREVNRLRATAGLKPVHRVLQNWLSTQLVLGLFPEWYGPPQPDWVPQIRLTGFPLYDSGKNGELPAALQEFCRASKPVVFTFGTGMAHPGELFQNALQACRRLGVRAVFLTKFRDQLPTVLPSNVHWCDFAPFRGLFPHCAAVVHHGGIGTVAEALAAGTPQLIRPIGFDQIDNGVRVHKLGAGTWLKSRRWQAGELARTLPLLLSNEAQQRARALAAQVRREDGLLAAAEHVENLARAAGPHCLKID